MSRRGATGRTKVGPGPGGRRDEDRRFNTGSLQSVVTPLSTLFGNVLFYTRIFLVPGEMWAGVMNSSEREWYV